MDLSREAMRVTDTHVYFHGGPCSQWWLRSRFTAELPVMRDDGRGDRMVRSGEPLVFSSAEKFMMAGKASMFGDGYVLGEIMKIDDVKEIKALGRKVVGRKGGDWDKEDIAFWNRASVPVVLVGTLAKFTQDDGLHGLMEQWHGRTFVEGAPNDRIWGVGLSWKGREIEDPRNWKGENRLGNVLMRADAIIHELGRDLDPWTAAARALRNRAPTSAPSP